MSKSALRRALRIALETAYNDGTDASSSPILIRNDVDVKPVMINTEKRNVIQSFFGTKGVVVTTSAWSEINFTTEACFAAAAGGAPPFGELLQMCAMSKTVTGSAITGTAQAGATATLTLASGASATDDAYLGMPITTTGGTGSGQRNIIIAYNGTSKVATMASEWDTTPDNTTTYSIAKNTQYRPVTHLSDASDSGSVIWDIDGKKQTVTGARGTFTLTMDNAAIPVFKFALKGLLGTITDASFPSIDLSSWTDPTAVNHSNSGDIKICGVFDPAVKKLSFDIGNTVEYRTTTAGESIIVTDRSGMISFSVEDEAVAAGHWLEKAQTATTGVFSIRHGTVSSTARGFSVVVRRGQMVDPGNSVDQNIVMYDGRAEMIPSSAGNDEIVITTW